MEYFQCRLSVFSIWYLPSHTQQDSSHCFQIFRLSFFLKSFPLWCRVVPFQCGSLLLPELSLCCVFLFLTHWYTPQPTLTMALPFSGHSLLSRSLTSLRLFGPAFADLLQSIRCCWQVPLSWKHSFLWLLWIHLPYYPLFFLFFSPLPPFLPSFLPFLSS